MAENEEFVLAPKELLLICLVSMEPAIYNPEDKLYRNAVHRNNKWIIISDSVGWSERKCKAKWKALRDSYCQSITRSSSRPKWKYFRVLEFLRPFVERSRNILDPFPTSHITQNNFEKELIAMVQTQNIIYNTSNINYRNTGMKMKVWQKIARRLDKSVKQCRVKWKALRDQYHRENRRLKRREEAASSRRWKHYKALKFLENYSHRSSDSESNESDSDMSNTITSSPPSPAATVIISPQHSVDANLHENTCTFSNRDFSQQHQQQQSQTASASANVTTPTGEDSAATLVVASHLGVDDEYRAFSRLIELKMREAKIKPTEFTDIEIDILQIINGVVKNQVT